MKLSRPAIQSLKLRGWQLVVTAEGDHARMPRKVAGGFEARLTDRGNEWLAAAD